MRPLKFFLVLALHAFWTVGPSPFLRSGTNDEIGKVREAGNRRLDAATK